MSSADALNPSILRRDRSQGGINVEDTMSDEISEEISRRRINDAAEELGEALLGAGRSMSEVIFKKHLLTDFESVAALANAYWRIGVTAQVTAYGLDMEHFAKRMSDLLKDELRNTPPSKPSA